MDKSDCIVSLLFPIFNLSSHFCLLPSILITFHFFLLTSPFLFSQTPEWVYQYVNPQSTEYPYAITVDSIGNTYTTGCIFIGTSRGLGVIHLDYTGTNGWVYFNDTLGVGETGYDIIFAFNRIYLVGETGNDDVIVACIDTLGSELWLYCDTFASCGYAIGVSESHHIYVAGIKYPSPPDWVVLKLDSLGNLCWRYVYDGPAGSYDEASSIVIDGNENIYVGGYSTGLGTSTDFTIIKLDSAGNEKWVYRYDGPASYRDELKALTIDSSGSVYGAGGSWSGIGSWDFLVVKLDSNGNERWVYRFDGYAHYYDWAEDVVVDDSGFVYACGLSYLYNNTLQYFAVIVLDSGGVEFWRYLTAGPLGYGGYPRRMVLDGLGYIYACGNLDGYLAVVKLSGLGNEEWVYKDPYAMIARGIVADVAGNIYVAGQRRVSQWNDDIVVMKFAAPQGEVKEVVGNEPIAKNHCSAIFKGGIEFMPEEDCRIKVYDVMGRMVVNKALQSGRKECIKLRSGVYFMCINSAEKMEHRKIVVLE